MKDSKRDIMRQQTAIINDEKILDELDEKIKDLTPEVIKALPKEAIEQIYTIDGKPLELNIIDIKDEQRLYEFKKDFLVYKKESMNANKQIDEALEKFEKEMVENEAELNELIKSYGDLTHYIRQSLQEDYEKATVPEIKAKFEKMIIAFDDAITLNRIFENYNVLNPQNSLNDYKLRSDSLFKKYMGTIKNLGIRTDITAFNNLELRFLPEKYHEYPNLFLFLIIKYFAHKKDTASKASDGVFLSQLLVNVKTLFTNRFTDENQKQTFLESIEKVLDLFI
jgi:hypothetical protein